MATVSIGTPSVAPIKTPTPRDSMPFTTTKGLLNGPGQNNCFLNSAVQVLWHLDIFRRSFRDVTGHACMAESCIFCALKELFSQLQFSNETALPPDALRRALAESFFDQQRFQLGFMDDAAECFENILMRIHSHIAQGISEDMCNVRQCIPHQKFAMTLVEQSICGACDATSEPLSFTQMVHYVSASALTMQFRQNSINGRSQSSSDSFGELLRQAGSMGDIRDCPSSCGAKIQICRTLMNRPEIVSVGIVWDSERPTLEHIMDVFATVGTTLKLADLFHKVVDNRWAEITAHNLVGVVTYYGKHYSTFFFHTKFRVWIYFDDATVREIGPRWEQVIEKCRRGRHQPLLLLYAVPNGTPVTLDNAQLITEKNKNEALLRRSVTPSPEKPIIGNTRRAITPNPDGQKPRMYNEYQNLSVIQDNIYGRSLSSVDVVDGDLSNYRKPTTIQRTLSNGSSSGVESFNTPDHHPTTTRRRDSGNWSGDRNSASSASSTTMENPYLYLIGRVPSVPGSPTRKTDHTGNALFDQGYDSYSLSSNDSSSMSTIQHLMKMGHLAKIPEDYNHRILDKQNCDGLCTEADELLKKSRHFEDEHDLVLALALCNAAATKARAAMNAPYNNPQTLTLARMKYNTCIMRARSLHRRMTQAQGITTKEVQQPEIRHTREGSSGSGKHSRQNSRDKTHHSRQNSRELLVPSTPQIEKSSPQKTIEIYATLPKKKDLKNKVINIEEDSEYVLYDKPPTRESRSLFSKSKNKDTKIKEKRSRSEDRNKLSKDFSIAPDILLNGKDTLKKKEDKEEKKDKDKNKKQHKIRRKLLMGGLIRRKNRSMPDLTEANDDSAKEKPIASSIDDSSIGIKNENINSMCGYLSEGHLEFSGTGTNPTLERSKLMRKSYHGSAGKVLTAAKVPPPPPLRTTSQLSNAKMNEVDGQKFPDNNFYNQYHHIETIEAYPQYASEVASLPYVSQNNCHHQRSGSSDILIYLTRDAAMMNTVVTQAEVHQVQSPAKHDGNFYHTPQQEDPGVDEVDCLPPMPASLQNFDLPPYPSPASSVVHSRQPSEEFPPPPPPLDLSALEEHLPEASSKPTPSTLLSQLQNKRLEILSQDEKPVQETAKSSGDTWLRELQAKQAALRQKKAANLDAITVQKDQNDATKNAKSSVRDLASRFENITETQPNTVEENHDYGQFLQYRDSKADNTVQTGVLSLKKREDEVTCEEMQLQRSNSDGEDKKSRIKKKSVSFCDQVILVATAEEQEDDSYIPNPILERVLRTAMNKPEAAAIRQEILMRQNKGKGQNEQEKSARTGNQPEPAQPVYIRQNSVDNLINRQNQPEPVHYRTQASNPQVQRQSPYHMMHGYTPNGQNLIANGQNLITNGQNYTGNGQNFIGNQNSVDNLINRQSLPEPVYVRQNSVDNLLNKQSQEYNNFEYRNQASNSQVQRQSPYHMMHGYTPNGQNFVSNGQNYEENAQNLITNGQNLIPNGQNLIANGQNSIGNGQNSIGNGQNSIGNGQNSIGNGQNFAGSPNYIQNNNQIYVQNGQRYPLYGNDGFPGRSGYPNGQTQQESVQNQCSSSPRNIYPHPQELGMQNHGQRSPYNQNQNVPVRPASYNHQGSPNYHPAYQHPPSPSPSTQSYTTQSSYQGSPVTQYNQQYQRVPPIHDYPGQNVFPKQEQTSQNMYQRNDLVQNSPYQRVPDPNYQYQRLQQPKIPQQTQNLKKTVSFEPGTKGGAESPTPKAVVTPIIVNNNVAYNSTKPKCNLCRKKNVLAPSLYCGDCEFYMSRFKPKT